MKNKKGFTLTELIGVITLLSIIAVMAGLSITSMLAKNKRKIAMETAKSYVKAINDNNFINDPDNYISSASVSEINQKINKQISGDLPKNGSVTVSNETKEVSSATLYIKGYIVSYNGVRYTITTQ